MSTREQVYDLLNRCGTSFVSGQEIADKLFVTRAAVWKAIKSLQKDGYNIEAVTNKGYRLVTNNILPSLSEIRDYLLEVSSKDSVHSQLEELEIEVHAEVESTNDLAKGYANDGCRKPCVIIADSQTKGRGRRGREFFSPSGTGIYMSFLLFPNVSPGEATIYTCMMAECVYRAIKRVTGVETQIKWVNDIYYGDKKIAGILTEGAASLEEDVLDYMVIGVGLNIYDPYEGFPSDLAKKAGALFRETAEENIKNKLYGAIIYEFYSCLNCDDNRAFVDSYRAHSMLVGRYVKINHFSGKKVMQGKEYAFVTGIDDECHLMIRYDDDTEAVLTGGEVSVVKY